MFRESKLNKFGGLIKLKWSLTANIKLWPNEVVCDRCSCCFSQVVEDAEVEDHTKVEELCNQWMWTLIWLRTYWNDTHCRRVGLAPPPTYYSH